MDNISISVRFPNRSRTCIPVVPASPSMNTVFFFGLSARYSLAEEDRMFLVEPACGMKASTNPIEFKWLLSHPKTRMRSAVVGTSIENIVCKYISCEGVCSSENACYFSRVRFLLIIEFVELYSY